LFNAAQKERVHPVDRRRIAMICTDLFDLNEPVELRRRERGELERMFEAFLFRKIDADDFRATEDVWLAELDQHFIDEAKMPHLIDGDGEHFAGCCENARLFACLIGGTSRGVPWLTLRADAARQF